MSGTHTATEYLRPLTSTSTSRRTFGSSPSGAPKEGAAGSLVTSGQVERVLHPLRRVRRGDEVGVREDRDVGRLGGGDALDLELAERSQHPRDGDVAIAAPHDELADEVVVVLADLVARFEAAVPPHAETLRHPQLGDRPGRREEAAAGGVLGVDAHLDGMPRVPASTDSCVNDSGSPAATRSCSATRSSPVTSSVTGCSTCSRVFISRKKKSPSW